LPSCANISERELNMSTIYQVTVHGRKLESRDLRKLLARAVAEKRSMDQRMRNWASNSRELYPACAAEVAGAPVRVAV
jgi:hypothetical protein